MNDCQQTEELLVELLERELGDIEGARLDRHLAECKACREVARQNQAIRDAYGQAACEDVGADIASAVLAGARRELAMRRLWPRSVLVAAAAAAIILIAVLGGAFDRSSNHSPLLGASYSEAADLFEDGDYLGALDILEPLLTAEPSAERLSIMRLRAEALARLGATDDAVAAYAELAAEFPSEGAAARRQVKVLQQLPDEALRALEGLGYSEQ